MFSLNLPPRPQRPPSERKPRSKPLYKSPLLWTVVILVVVISLLFAASRIWTEVLWYQQLGFLSVFTTMWGTRIGLFVVGGLLMAAITWQAMFIALKTRPVYAPTGPKQPVDKYRELFEPLRKPALVVIPLLMGLFAGASAQGHWTEVLLAINSKSFGQTDPQFGLDMSFYIFILPVLRFVVSFVMVAVAMSLVVALLVHYLYGGVRLAPGPGERVSKAARRQLGISAAVFSVLAAGQYWLDRYSALNQQRELFDGAGYTAVHATIPAKALMAFIALFVAVLFLVATWRGDWKLPAIGLGLMVVSLVAVGWAYPALVQRFSVAPSEQTKEAPYIQHNIDATRAAFGLTEIEVQNYSARTSPEVGGLREDAEATNQIRLLDPTVVAPTYRQKEQHKPYYGFPDFLSVDRYEIDGKKRDTVIAVRDLKLSGLGTSATWVNQHTVYTHGYGVAAAYGNTTDTQGWPDFFERGIPTIGELNVAEPRIYFGTTSPEYSIVGGPEGGPKVELDYPSDIQADEEGLDEATVDAEREASGQVNTTFQGDGGPRVGSGINKLLYALRFGATDILFSSNVNPQSQILYDRDPQTRVQKVAPYLTLDERVYPAVVDGRIVWIVDAYTTTGNYPYSQHQTLSTATLDSVTA
ncbi:MAG: UPF0182 family protein, partial [Micrococcales bacterium]|nr:UPF0182 family protein [Micrococcales bacterium]